MRKLLKRLGCSFHKVSGFLFKADQDKQKKFVADYEQDKEKVQSDGWRRYFIDGVHPLYGLEVIFYCWLLVGQRFEVGVGGGRKHPKTKHFRIYLDNARYQHATLLKEWIEKTKKEKGVTFDLKHLPAYSPNLNLIERLWKFLRKEALQKWHPSFEEMLKAVAEVLDNLPRYRKQLETLMTERFHLTPVVSTIVVGVGAATEDKKVA